jgi:hypothetical protein
MRPGTWNLACLVVRGTPGRRGSTGLRTGEVGAVLAHTIRRIERHLRRRGVLPGNEDDDLHADPETGLAAAAVSGQVPPAGPQWAIRLRPPERRGLAYDKPL